MQQGLTKDEVDQMLDEFLLECAKKEGGNDADIKFLKDRNLPSTKQQDCMVACIGENFDLASRKIQYSLWYEIRENSSKFNKFVLNSYDKQVANGKILVDKVMKLATSVLADQPAKIDIISAIAEECQDGKDAERCQASHNIYDCGIKSADKHGFNLKDFV